MKLIPLLIGSVLGLGAGAASALVMSGMVGSGVRLSGGVDASGWQSDWTIGSTAANPWTRARIARHGLLALTKEEAVYFTRATDEDGNPLNEACTYRVSGTAMPALWWSVTLYDGDSRLPHNTDDALSYDLTEAAAEGSAEAWAFTVSTIQPDDGGWVSSRAAGNFDLTLRLYKPSPALLADPEATLPPPKIERVSCGEQGA
ncbi:MAG: DUF1214 domain-containing protein [Hyphomonas sp.]|nr:DUF1214 domain-containing protein [Hyphomonas sp.]